MLIFTLAISCLTISNLLWFMDQQPRFLCNIVLYSIGIYFLHQTHSQMSFVSALVQLLHSSWNYYYVPSALPQEHTGHLPTCGAHLPVPYIFAFSYCSWGSHRKNTGVVCHSLLQWITFCQNSSLWPICLGRPCTAWLIASLSYTNSFAMTRLWSTKRFISLDYTFFLIQTSDS